MPLLAGHITFLHLRTRSWQRTLQCSDYHKLGFTNLPITKPTPEVLEEDDATTISTNAGDGSHFKSGEADQKLLQDLHILLLETEVVEGKMICGNCGHEYKIKEGIANFLLPSHLGQSGSLCSISSLPNSLDSQCEKSRDREANSYL